MTEMTSGKNITVAVGMSGGVDSSLSACLLKKQGYSVIGLTMRKYGGEDLEESEPKKACCYGPGEERSIAAAQRVADFLDIPHYTIDLREEFERDILGYFKSEYLKGRTPNPCPRCNASIKFDLFLKKAREQGAEFDLFATGHYARIRYLADRKRHVVRKGLDPKKDQSYFLYGLEPALLPKLIFPLGDTLKTETRRRAKLLGLPIPTDSESQDFIEIGKYSSLFEGRDVAPGPIVDVSGKQLGIHKGIVNYTVGQRRGLGVSADRPLYVLEIDAADNTVTIGDKELLFSSGLIAENLNRFCLDYSSEPLRIQVKIRHSHAPADAFLSFVDDDRVKIMFDSPQMSVTPGQSAVFYQDDIVLGGGVIEEKIS